MANQQAQSDSDMEVEHETECQPMEFCFVEPNWIVADGLPLCSDVWVRMWEPNAKSIQGDTIVSTVHVVPPTHTVPVKYKLSSSFTMDFKPVWLFRHCREAHPPFICRLIPTLPLVIGVKARATSLKFTFTNPIHGACFHVMDLPKDKRWSVKGLRHVMVTQLIEANRYTKHVETKFIRGNSVLRGNVILWSPSWKEPKFTRRLTRKTSSDQLKITHFFLKNHQHDL